MQAIHLICKRDEDGGLRNMAYDKERGLSRSGNWDISEDIAQSLVGGWLYLHKTKNTLSEYGGTIHGFEMTIDSSVARSERIVFIVQTKPAGTDQHWRGKAHGMAHSGNPVPANLPHETE